PDSKHIAFSSSTTQEDIQKSEEKQKKATKTGDKQSAESEHESDVHVISRAIYRDNDEGYLDLKRHEHIWILDLPKASDDLKKPAQLTTGNFDEGGTAWSPDSSRIYFLTQRIDEPYYELPSTDIYSVAAAGGNPEKLATIPMGI